MGFYHHSVFLFGNRALLNHVVVFFNYFFIRVGHESEHALGFGDGQGSLECCHPWGGKELHTSEWLNWTDTCFTILLVSATQQSESALCIHTSPLSWPPSHPLTPPLYVITGHQAELSVLCSGSPLASHYTHGGVFLSNLISQFIQLSPFPPPYLHVHSLCLCLYSCLGTNFICTSSRFHIYVLIYDISFSLSDIWVPFFFFCSLCQPFAWFPSDPLPVFPSLPSTPETRLHKWHFPGSHCLETLVRSGQWEI